MSKLAASILLAAALFAGVSATAPAASARQFSWTDMSDPYGGYDPNSQQGNRTFWEYQGRHGS